MRWRSVAMEEGVDFCEDLDVDVDDDDGPPT